MVPITKMEDARELLPEERLSLLDLEIYDKTVEKANLLPCETLEDYLIFEGVIQTIKGDCGTGMKELLGTVRWLNDKFPDNPILIPSDYVTNLTEVESPDWLLPGMAVRNGLTLFYGESGTYKTILTVYMGYALMTGTDFFSIIPAGHCKVLYVEQDESLSMLKEQVQKIGYPREIFICAKLPVIWDGKKFNKEFYNTLAAIRPDVVFIDAYTSLGIEDITRPASALCLDSLRRVAADYRVSIIIIHHENKAGTQMGSALHVAKIDSELQVSKTTTDGNEEKIVLSQGKVRGQHFDAIYLKANKESLHIEREQNMTLAQMIRDMLSSGLDREIILSHFRGGQKESARRTLYRLQQEQRRNGTN